MNIAREVTQISAALANWYAAHSSIRRLWALDSPAELLVFITLEPTSDGDDALPVWLANNQDWAVDLQSHTHREIQLRLIASGVLETSYVDADAAMIAELSWRDPWASP